MPGGKRLSEDLKKAIIAFWQKNPQASYRKISETFGRPQSTIKALVIKFKKTGTVANDTSKHRQKSTTARQDREKALWQLDYLWTGSSDRHAT